MTELAPRPSRLGSATSAAPDAPLRAEIHRGQSGIDALREAWDALVSRMPHPHFFHQPHWYGSFLATLADDPESMIFCALYRGDCITAIYPLFAEGRKLTVPYHPHLPMGDVIATTTELAACELAAVLEALDQQLPRRWNVLRFPRLPAFSPLLSAAITVPHPIQDQRLVGHCDYLEITDYETMLKGWSRNLRSNIRRARRKLADLPDVRHTRADSPEQLDDALRTFLDLEASGWKGERGTAIKLDRRLTDFYQELTSRFGVRGECEIHTLWSGDQPLATQFLLRANDTLYELKLAYDENFAEIAPGNLLMEKVLQQCTQRPDIRYFNLVSDAPWHAKFRPQRWEIFDWILYRRPVQGRILRAGNRLRAASRAFAMKRIRPIYRRFRGKGAQH